MSKHLQLISAAYLDEYSSKVNIDWLKISYKFRSKPKFTTEDFEYYLIASSLYSSKIEGNTLDVDSFFWNRGKKGFPKKKEMAEIEDLVKAYEFAVDAKLNKRNLLKAHGLLSKQLLPPKEQGVIRNEGMWVREKATGKPVYGGTEPKDLPQEFNKLFEDIAELLKRDLKYKEIFYYASMIHLWFVKIHPFGDGNGRSARLLEKWFLASHLGRTAWSINSEKYYWDNRPDYYENVAIGYHYYVLKWERCIPFLLMLPESLKG